jgi:hypothetical protein
LKQVHMTRLKSRMTGKPSSYCNSSGTTVQPRRTPVNPAAAPDRHQPVSHSRSRQNAG